MTAAWVKDEEASGTGTSVAKAFGSNTTAGNSVIVCIRASTGRTITVTDSQGNTYSTDPGDKDQIQTVDGYESFLFSAHNIVGGACTVTVAISGASGNIRFAILEYSRSLSSS